MASTHRDVVTPRRRIANSQLVLKAALATTRFLGRWAPSLAAVPAGFVWFTPWRVPVSERGLAKQNRWLEGTQTTQIRTSVGRVSVFTAGAGETVLLVHGWGESSPTLGGFIAPLTAAGYRVVGIDLPGHGRSGGGRTNILASGQAIAEVAANFQPAAAVVAHSMGANAALWALRHCGLAVNRVALLAPNVDFTYALSSFTSLFSLRPETVAGLKQRIERRFGNDVWDYLRGDVLAADLDDPGLVFHDPSDPQIPFEGSQRLVEAWAGAELVEVPGLGHGAITRDAHVIDRIVTFVGSERASGTQDTSQKHTELSGAAK